MSEACPISKTNRPRPEKIVAQLGGFLKQVGAVFQVPFIGLPLILWFYVVIAYIAMPHNQIWLGDLPDPDDYSYLSQAIDFLQGQGWFDHVQWRMAPPEGVELHFSRLAQMPIAALIWMFHSFGWSWRGAGLEAAWLLPWVYLGVMFYVMRKTVERFVSPSWARLSSFVLIFSPILLFRFAPGQIDHHGIELILITVVLGLTAGMFDAPQQAWRAAVAGFVLAAALAIALEVLPWVILISFVVGLWMLGVGPRASKTGALFGTSLFAGSAVMLALHRPWNQLFIRDDMAFSSVYVALTGIMALALGFGAIATHWGRNQTVVARLTAWGEAKLKALQGAPHFCFPDRNGVIRLGVAGGVSVGLAAVFFTSFPELLKGPYGAMDKRLAALFFDHLEEAIPMVDRFVWYKTALYMFSAVFGTFLAGWFVWNSRGIARWKWVLIAVLLVAADLLAVFYQARISNYASLFAIIPLTAFAEKGWAWIAAHRQGRNRFWSEIGLVVLLGPLANVFLSGIVDGRSFGQGVLMSVAQGFDNPCSARRLVQVLNTPPYAGRKLRIMNMIGQGPEMLFFTSHEVMSAPYHRNVRGNLDAVAFFSTTNLNESEEIARRNNIDLVAYCRYVPDMYMDGPPPHFAALPQNGGYMMLPNASLAGQLGAQKVPAWLKPVPLPKGSNHWLFEVVKK